MTAGEFQANSDKAVLIDLAHLIGEAVGHLVGFVNEIVSRAVAVMHEWLKSSSDIASEGSGIESEPVTDQYISLGLSFDEEHEIAYLNSKRVDICRGREFEVFKLLVACGSSIVPHKVLNETVAKRHSGMKDRAAPELLDVIKRLNDALREVHAGFCFKAKRRIGYRMVKTNT